MLIFIEILQQMSEIPRHSAVTTERLKHSLVSNQVKYLLRDGDPMAQKPKWKTVLYPAGRDSSIEVSILGLAESGVYVN